jgi:hypothetical protein
MDYCGPSNTVAFKGLDIAALFEEQLCSKRIERNHYDFNLWQFNGAARVQEGGFAEIFHFCVERLVVEQGGI